MFFAKMLHITRKIKGSTALHLEPWVSCFLQNQSDLNTLTYKKKKKKTSFGIYIQTDSLSKLEFKIHTSWIGPLCCFHNLPINVHTVAAAYIMFWQFLVHMKTKLAPQTAATVCWCTLFCLVLFVNLTFCPNACCSFNFLFVYCLLSTMYAPYSPRQIPRWCKILLGNK